MKRILITLSFILLISKVFASTYSLYVIEDFNNSFDKHSEMPLQTLLAKADRIKVFVQTTAVSSADEPGTVQTHSVPYVDTSDDNKSAEAHQEAEIGTRFRVIEGEGSIAVEFSHREIETWIYSESEGSLQPIFSNRSVNTDINPQVDKAYILGSILRSDSRNNSPGKQTHTIIILVRGALDNAKVDLRNLPKSGDLNDLFSGSDSIEVKNFSTKSGTTSGSSETTSQNETISPEGIFSP